MQTQRKTYRKICQNCGKEFLAFTSVTSCCSDRCAKLLDKHRKRNERLKKTTLEVRETQRLALLDKNYLTLSDAAKLMQISRNTLYKVISMHSIPLKRFSGRTVRISRSDLEKAGLSNATLIDNTATTINTILENWLTREQVMEKYGITHSWFYSTTKKHPELKVKTIGCKSFYDVVEMDNLFKTIDTIKEWYTFDELKKLTGMRSESISDYCKDHKIPRTKKNGITYVSKTHWDQARGTTIDPAKYITIKEIIATYKLSRNHLFTIFKENGLERIKIGNFVYLLRDEVAKTLNYRLSKL